MTWEGCLDGRFMAPTLLTLKNYSSNMGNWKFQWIVAKISYHICRSKKNPNSEIKVENHGKQVKYPFKACLHYPECSDKPRLALAQHSNFWGPCVTIAAGIMAKNTSQHRGSQWSLLRIHTNILPACKDYHSKWEQCADSPICNHLRPVVFPRKLSVILFVLQWN